MKFHLTEKIYSVELSKDRMFEIHRADNEKGFGEPCLFNLLEKLDGVREVNYDLMFGAFIFIRVETSAPWRELKSQIIKIINNFS